jgi:signal transduction histidine kinase
MYTDLEGQVEVRTRHLATINAVASVTSRSLDLAEILHAALGTMLGAMGFEAGVAYRLLSDEDTLLLISSRGLSEESAHKVREVRLGALASKAQLSKGPLMRLVADYPPQELRETLQQEGWRMAISVPLLARGELLGVMNLRALTPRPVTPEEFTLLAAIGEQVGVALENALLYERAGEVAVAAERNRLGQELHDSISQALFSANLLAGVIPILLEQNPAGARERLAELARLTRGALAEMRALLVELRPAALARTSLAELLHQLTEAITNSTQVPVRLTLDGNPDVPTAVRIGLYRIAQEALNNVVKHAQASQVWVDMHVDADRDAQRTVTLSVRDDGRGFDPARIAGECLGLGIMQERAGEIGATLSIESRPGAGTQVTVVWRGRMEPENQGPSGRAAAEGEE